MKSGVESGPAYGPELLRASKSEPGTEDTGHGDESSGEEFRTLSPGSVPSHWTRATCALDEKPGSPYPQEHLGCFVVGAASCSLSM